MAALQGLSAECAAVVSAAAHRLRYTAGAVLCRQGEPSARLELIESGRAVASVVTGAGSQVSLGVLGPGDVVGELSVLDLPGEHPATVTAVEETATLALGRTDFDRVRRRFPELSDLVTRALARRLELVTRGLVQDLTGTAEQRVLRKLLSLAETSGPVGGGRALALTQEELGRLTGTARGTVNRILGREAAVGTVRLARGRIEVLDTVALQARVGEALVHEDESGITGHAAEQERRVVTVVVIGLSVTQAAGADVEEGGSALVHYQDAVRAEVELCGGAFQGFQGDTGVAVFGAPVARGGEAERGTLAAARSLEAVGRLSAAADGGRAFALAGVATGEAVADVVGGDDAHPGIGPGDLVQRAARLRAAAPAGRVLVDEATHQATRRVLAYERSAEGWLHAPGAAAPAVRASPLVGREAELGQLWSSWETVVAERRPRLVTVLGVPGIGKSRLAAELAARVEAAGGRCLKGRSLPYGGGLGYGAFTQMVMSAAGISDGDPAALVGERLAAVVRAAVPDRAEEIASHFALMAGLPSGTGPPDQQAMFRSGCVFVEALGRSRPTLLIFEDVHWADASLQDLVRALAARVRGAPVMLLALARPELLDRRPDWSGGLASALTIELDGLGPDHAWRLAEANLPSGVARAGLARPVEIAEGNPLFIEELAATMADRGSATAAGLPTTITTAIEARLDALAPSTRKVLVNASVIGRTFWLGALARLVSGTDLGEHLEQLEDRGFIRREPVSRYPADPEYAFKHILVRDVAYATIPRRGRDRAHAQVARFLERTLDEPIGEAAILLAHHWREAGELQRSLRYLVEAADRSGRAAAHREAVLLLAEAIELAGLLGRPELPELRAQRGIALARIGRWREAREELDAACGANLEPAERRIQVFIELAQVSHWLLDLEGCSRHAATALELARAAGRSDLAAAALGTVALAHSSAGRVSASLEGLRTSIATAGEHRFQLLGPTVELCALTLYWTGRPAEAVALGEEALRIGEEFGDVNTSIRTLGNLGLAQAGSGRYADAFATFDRARAFGREYGTATFLARALAMAGGVHLDLFDHQAAAELAGEAREMSSSLGFPLPVVSSGIDLVLNWARTGDVARAEAMIRETEVAVAAAQGAHGWLWRLRLAQARAETAAARGDWAESERWAREVLERARATGRVKYEVAALGVQARAQARRGRHGQAAATARRALEAAAPTGDPALRLRAALVAIEVGAGEAAATALEAARAIAAGLPAGETRRRFVASDAARLAGLTGRSGSGGPD